MYIESVPNRNSPPAILLRESFRGEDGKVKKRTLANLSKCSPQVIDGLRALLRGGHVSDEAIEDSFKIHRSLSHGNVAAVLGTLRKIGLHLSLDRQQSPQRALAIALITGRILEPASKLAFSRLVGPESASNTLSQELDLGSPDANDFYAAMRWILDRQAKIEATLAKKYLKEDCAVLYDLTSTWYEGSHCPLAQFGHNRDKKRGKRQINIGLLCNADGCPISVQVYPGSTADPATVSSQLETLREKFGLKRVIIVGDRGMLTSARIEQIKSFNGSHDQEMDLDLGNYGWISALRADQIQKLAAAGSIDSELFDQRDLAEIACEESFPGERLVVCRNPFLAEERTRKRNELLDITEKKLGIIRKATQRDKNPFWGKARIARRVERECAKHKMLKHFILEISEQELAFSRNKKSIVNEAHMDGFYIIRAGRISTNEMTSEKIVQTYKSLSKVERNFRAIKTTALKVRPIFHHKKEMVCAHILICMLAAHLRWHMEQKLAPVLFYDEIPGGATRVSPVAKADRSEHAKNKVATKRSADDLPVHSFSTLLADLSSLCRHTIVPSIENHAEFFKLTEPTPIQKKALDLLGVSLQPIPACTQ